MSGTKKFTDLKVSEEQVSRFTQTITRHSTFLLMIAVIAFFLTTLFGFYYDPVSGDANAYILGSAALTSSNLIHLEGLGALFAVINAVLWAIVYLCAGLSFAAVCFDETKNIYFRVISVAALMLIIFGGLNIM